jgi:glycogen synthase
MAMSCPVVVSRVGGMEEMLRHGGGMSYAPGDVNALCDVLVPLVENADARRRLGEQARQAVEQNFSFERMLNEFDERVLSAREEPALTQLRASDRARLDAWRSDNSTSPLGGLYSFTGAT